MVFGVWLTLVGCLVVLFLVFDFQVGCWFGFVLVCVCICYFGFGGLNVARPLISLFTMLVWFHALSFALFL